MPARNPSDSTAAAAETLLRPAEAAPAGGNAGAPAPAQRPPHRTKGKCSKMVTRLQYGTPMIAGFFLLVWLGHPYMVLLVCFLQAALFKELVNVRYKPAKEREVPLFRTFQWAMFVLAMSHVYGQVFVKLGLAHSAAQSLPTFIGEIIRDTIRYHKLVTFSGYVTVFVGFVLSLKHGLYKYQIGNTVWTVGVLALIVWQIAGTVELIFAGLVWFMLPCSLVVANDCFAYFSGIAFGRKFIDKPFLALSPNKTWEGFIGAFVLTIIWGWFFSDMISRLDWLVCPQRNFDLFVHFPNLSCTPAPLFRVQRIALPFDDLPLMTVQARPFQIHAVFLALFASVVAPFGGFFASAVKRAYRIKDFDSLIPGHGGFMDRMDCQFLMLLCTFVHYRTFVGSQELPDDRLLALISALPAERRASFMQKLLVELNISDTCA